MARLVICDTSSLIRLRKTDTLFVLPVMFDEIIIPTAVLDELQARPSAWLQNLPHVVVAPTSTLNELYGLGEREALAITGERPGSVLLTDDRKAMKAADRSGLNLLTSYDIFVAAKALNLVPSTHELIRRLIAQGEGVTNKEIADMLAQTGEAPFVI